jgi:predicted NUDIX family NTP pyrophosphohydrolase
MAKQSAGLLLYRKLDSSVEVLIVHPGGPFWAKKDKGAWSLPKGEFVDGEDGLSAAKREFKEELGLESPEGAYTEIGSVKYKSGKTIHAWALEGDMDVSAITSNTITMEWPPRSGKQQEFPEVDKAGWFGLEKAKEKLNPAQTLFIDRLAEILGTDLSEPPEQASLF